MLSKQNKKKMEYICTWTDQDQRVIEEFANWPNSDLNNTDLTFRPYYLPL